MRIHAVLPNVELASSGMIGLERLIVLAVGVPVSRVIIHHVSIHNRDVACGIWRDLITPIQGDIAINLA